MSKFLDNTEPSILPRKATAKTALLSVVSNLEKLAIIEEGEGVIARNSGKLNLSNSIYEKNED